MKAGLEREQIIKLVRIIAAALLTLVAWLIPVEGIWSLLLFAVPYLLAGWDVVFGAILNILHGELFDEEFLMTAATAGAFAIGEYPEAAGVMIFFQIGELFEDIAVGRSRKSIAALMDIRPDRAVVIRNGEHVTVSPSEVAVGEIVEIIPGERIPLDGIIVEGRTSVDAAALTGESMPVDKNIGDEAVSGTVNLTGVIKLRVTKPYGESTVSKILALVADSSEKKARSESFITRFSRIYTPCVVFAAIILAVFAPLAFDASWSEWINRALIFLMVSCPCALVVSVPLTFFTGIGAASARGVLIKGSNYLETLAKTDIVVFDKTGTLTRGVFSVSAIHPTGVSEAELLDIAAAAESYSTHPVAESVVRAHKGHIEKSRITEVTEHPGMGVSAVIDGTLYYAGNGKLMEKAGADWHECHISGTSVHISRGNEYLGHIIVSDEVKEDSAAALKELKNVGVVKTVMLTGDNESQAERIAKAVGIDEVHAGLFPDKKVSVLEGLLAPESVVTFVGDGVNDAPVLARADVGVAMGAIGSDAAIEAADVVLMDDKVSKLPLAIKLSRRTLRIVRQNIVFAIGVKMLILALSALGVTGMWMAVLGDVGVLVLAVLNSLRAAKTSFVA